MIFETNDLIIRPSEWEDIDDFYQWEQKPEVTEFFSIKDGQTKEDVIRKYIADDENPQAEQFTILLKKGEEFINGNFTGAIFKGVVKDETKVGDFDAIIPVITGSAYVSGISTHLIDPTDPLKWGFVI